MKKSTAKSLQLPSLFLHLRYQVYSTPYLEDKMRKVMKFEVNGHWIFGWYDSETDEFTLPSGYIMPVENGYVFYLLEWRKLIDAF